MGYDRTFCPVPILLFSQQSEMRSYLVKAGALYYEIVCLIPLDEPILCQFRKVDVVHTNRVRIYFSSRSRTG